ncbi:MAG: hypothetical protein WD118_10625 [Phycisphaeraceae bacterium]
MPTPVYELKCPSCGQVLRAAFVRAGAVTDCPRCAHRYRIKETHVARKVATAGEDGKPSLLPGAKELASMAGARLRVAEDGHVIGLSGLSEMMQHEGVGVSRSRHASAAAGDAPPPPGRPPRTPSPSRRLNGPRSLYLIASTLCLGLAVVGVALWHASTGAPGGPRGASAGAMNLPMIMAVRLSHEPWTRPNQPFDRSDHASRPNPGIRLTDTNLRMPVNGQPKLMATVTTDGPEVIWRARIDLSLVDQTDVAVARTQVDVGMVARGHGYRLQLPLPTDLAGQWLGVVSQVEVIEALEAGRLMDGAMVVPTPNAAMPGVRLLAANTSDELMRRTLFLITAWDEDDQPIMRWRATWQQPVAPGQPIECQVVIPTLPETPVQRWGVQMMGQPVPDEAASEPAGSTMDESTGAETSE